MNGHFHRSRALCALPVTLALPLLLIAQSQKAQLTGNITDPSGALVPGVQVTVRNVATDDQRTTTSNENGIVYDTPVRPW